MAGIEKMMRWLKSHYFIASVLLLSAALGSYKLYKELTMPPPLVYLIPEDFFGPVFVFFGQSDGVEPQPDPLGHAVKVPENGVVKIRAKVADTIPFGGDVRPIYWVKISADGSRSLYIARLSNTSRNDNGDLLGYYVDKDSKMNSYVITDNQKPYFYLTDAQKAERLITGDGGCAHQEFRQQKSGPIQQCGKFLVISPNEDANLPAWLWDDLDGEYTSIEALEADMNKVMEKKKRWMPITRQP